MPLHVSPAPAPALRSVLAALGSPTAVREAHTPALRSVQGSLSPELPLPVHVLDRIVPNEAAPRTRLAGWRFLIRSGERAVAAADTMLTADGWTFSHFFEGPYIVSTELAVRQAESTTTPYQPRLLSVPELYMFTLWLHRDTEADAGGGSLAPTDVLVPLAPAPPGITAHRPHRVADLLPVMTLRVTPAPLPDLPELPGLLGSPA
ncbi:hypothetical protein [Streptomyces sp. gb1(2016)]|uniref:Uncharacterized protein n=1 Tax=Streptomyces sp. gb1(2016) TaxID=1828321 RepID=A0A652KP12_9ACTN|nr:hypothetical protein [Streptomyces sp. gb1(2016)]TXS25439.1 hypothetical protein EAO74_34760 [Streptomyces sp. gb1(2016)]